MTITYRPKGVCSRLMRVEVENGIIRKVEVQGGCSGNPTRSREMPRRCVRRCEAGKRLT